MFYCDINSLLDYVIVGVVENIGEKEIVGLIFYVLYIEGFDLDEFEYVGVFKVVVDLESL